MSLGRGLGALIPQMTIKRVIREAIEETGEKIINIDVDFIEPNPEQPRKNFSRLEMEELINSIREYGVIQPIIAIRSEDNKYQIVAGERRWRAVKFLELKTIPTIIRSIKKSQRLELSLIENIQRKNLNPMEIAVAYHRLMDEFNLTQEQVSKRLGKARSSIANALRLLTLPEIIQQAIEQEKISEGHAKALLAANDNKKQKSLLKRILGMGLTVKETEKIVKGKRVRKWIELDPILLEKERELSNFLGTKVKIIKRGKKLKIIIEAYDNEDLDEIINKIINNNL